MKIPPPNQTNGVSYQNSVKKTPLSESGPSFGHALDQAVERQSASRSQTPQTLGIVRPPMVSAGAQPTPQESADLIETTLQALESYRGALADAPKTSLRHVDALLSSLDSQRQSMDAMLSHLPNDDPLRQIGAQASAAILAEQGRFKSGLYN